MWKGLQWITGSALANSGKPVFKPSKAEGWRPNQPSLAITVSFGFNLPAKPNFIPWSNQTLPVTSAPLHLLKKFKVTSQINYESR